MFGGGEGMLEAPKVRVDVKLKLLDCKAHAFTVCIATSPPPPPPHPSPAQSPVVVHVYQLLAPASGRRGINGVGFGARLSGFES